MRKSSLNGAHIKEITPLANMYNLVTKMKVIIDASVTSSQQEYEHQKEDADLFPKMEQGKQCNKCFLPVHMLNIKDMKQGNDT